MTDEVCQLTLRVDQVRAQIVLDRLRSEALRAAETGRVMSVKASGAGVDGRYGFYVPDFVDILVDLASYKDEVLVGLVVAALADTARDAVKKVTLSFQGRSRDVPDLAKISEIIRLPHLGHQGQSHD